MGKTLNEAFGLKSRQEVCVLEETSGTDHDDIEHTMPAGSKGIIDHIEVLPPPQGIAFHVWIPVNEEDDRGIVNVFDEGDGPISNFIKAWGQP